LQLHVFLCVSMQNLINVSRFRTGKKGCISRVEFTYFWKDNCFVFTLWCYNPTESILVAYERSSWHFWFTLVKSTCATLTIFIHGPRISCAIGIRFTRRDTIGQVKDSGGIFTENLNKSIKFSVVILSLFCLGSEVHFSITRLGYSDRITPVFRTFLTWVFHFIKGL
jgi:hypothetical protein